ncbi:MAG: alpha/beta hydrolase [Cyanobacteria bacterium P01_C01_bin.38]
MGASCSLIASHYPLPITNAPCPIPNYPLPITNYPLPIPNLLNFTNH